MDFRAVTAVVLTVLVLLVPQGASFKLVTVGAKSDAVKETIPLIQETIQTVLGHLNDPLLFPNDTCQSLNATKLASVLEQPFTAQNLFTFLWYVSEMAEHTPVLKRDLLDISEHLKGMSVNSTDCQDCKLPTFQEDMHSHMFVKCLLKLLADYLKKAML